MQATASLCGVATDGAVGQRGPGPVVKYAAAAAELAELSRTVQLVSVAGSLLNIPPPSSMAELPLTMQLVSVAVPLPKFRPPPKVAELPLTVQLVSIVVAFSHPHRHPSRRSCR